MGEPTPCREYDPPGLWCGPCAAGYPERCRQLRYPEQRYSVSEYRIMREREQQQKEARRVAWRGFWSEFVVGTGVFTVIKVILVVTGIITAAELLIAGPSHWLVGTWIFWGGR